MQILVISSLANEPFEININSPGPTKYANHENDNNNCIDYIQ